MPPHNLSHLQRECCKVVYKKSSTHAACTRGTRGLVFLSSPLSFPSQSVFSWEFSEGEGAKQTLTLLLLLCSYTVKHACLACRLKNAKYSTSIWKLCLYFKFILFFFHVTSCLILCFPVKLRPACLWNCLVSIAPFTAASLGIFIICVLLKSSPSSPLLTDNRLACLS